MFQVPIMKILEGCMWTVSLLLLAVILALVVGPTLPVVAQEPTDTTETTNIVAAPVVEVIAPLPSEAVRSPVVQTGFDVLTFVVGLVSGAAGVLAGMFGMVGRLKNDKAALDAIEWLGRSIPVEALDKLNKLGQTMQDTGVVLEMVTDGLPNDPPSTAMVETRKDPFPTGPPQSPPPIDARGAARWTPPEDGQG